MKNFNNKRFILLFMVFLLIFGLLGCNNKSSTLKYINKFQILVVEEQGQKEVPIADTQVEFAGEEKLTNNQGIVTFENIKEGYYNLTVKTENYKDYVENNVEVAENKTSHKVVFNEDLIEGEFEVEKEWQYDENNTDSSTEDVTISEEEFELTIPKETVSKGNSVNVKEFSVDKVPSAGNAFNILKSYEISIDNNTESRALNNLDQPIVSKFNIMNQDPSEILLLSYHDHKWRLLDEEIKINSDSIEVELDSRSKLAITHVNIKHGQSREVKRTRKITEEGNYIQEFDIQPIEGVIGDYGESPWYKIDLLEKNNLRSVRADDDYLFNEFDMKYIPPGGGKDLEFIFHGVGGYADLNMISSGKELLPIFYTDIFYMLLSGGDSLPYPIKTEDMLTGDLKETVDFYQYIKEEVKTLSEIEFNSIHNSTIQLLKWGKNKILNYAEEKSLEKLKKLIGTYWWTFVGTTNRSVSSVVFMLAKEDAQYFEIYAGSRAALQIKPESVNLVPGESADFTVTAHPREQYDIKKDIQLTVPEWRWSTNEIGEITNNDEKQNTVTFTADEELEPGQYNLEVSTKALYGEKMIDITTKAVINIIRDAPYFEVNIDQEKSDMTGSPGEIFTIYADIENKGQKEATQDIVVLTEDGQQQLKKSVTLKGNQTSTVKLSGQVPENSVPGKGEVTVSSEDSSDSYNVTVLSDTPYYKVDIDQDKTTTEVRQGDDCYIIVYITNYSRQSGQQDIKLKVTYLEDDQNNTEDYQTIENDLILEAEETKTIEFHIPSQETEDVLPGDYKGQIFSDNHQDEIYGTVIED